MTAVARKITRDLNEDVRDRVRALAETDRYEGRYRDVQLPLPMRLF